MDSTLLVHTERTPNPASVRWVLNRPVLENPSRVGLERGTPAEVSPLAARLFSLSGVSGVLLGEESIVVNKADDADWREVGREVTQAIRDWVASGEPALGEAWVPPPEAAGDEVLARIRSVLEEEIAPFIESDGGEILLRGFRDGVVEVSLRGACEGCPSSGVTLRMGVEARLREEIPEVHSVVAI